MGKSKKSNKKVAKNHSKQRTAEDKIKSNGCGKVSKPLTNVPHTEVPRLYGVRDQSPYFAHVRYSAADGQPKYLTISKIPQKLRECNIKYELLGVFGKNEWILTFPTRNDANRSTSNKNVAEHGLKIYIPQNYLFRKGKIFDVPQDITMKELQQAIKGDNRNPEILNIRRIPQCVEMGGRELWLDSDSVYVEFKGRTLPDFLYTWNCRIPVVPFVETLTICYNCGGYRHPKKYCSKPKICLNCGKDYHLEKGQHCSLPACCVNCGGTHKSRNRFCPVLMKEKAINSIMAVENLPYLYAKRTFEERAFERSRISPSLSDNKENVKPRKKKLELPNETLSALTFISRALIMDKDVCRLVERIKNTIKLHVERNEKNGKRRKKETKQQQGRSANGIFGNLDDLPEEVAEALPFVARTLAADNDVYRLIERINNTISLHVKHSKNA